MKRKIFLLFILCTLVSLTTGCFDSDKLEGSNITTTVYPIEYLVTRLYGTNSKITSIYPDGTDTTNYDLTEKKISEVAKKTDIFVYNGLTNEKEIAKTLQNKNNKLKIIDVSYNYGKKYKYGFEEIWLNPNNYLLLATNIKDELKELSASKYAAENIESNFKQIEVDLATLDAELRSIATTAKNEKKGTIVIAYDTFGFLETYGFDVVNITSPNNITSSIKNKFKNGTYKQILVANKNNVSDSVKDLVDNYQAELIEINTMQTLTDAERNNNDNYLTIMDEFITKVSNAALS